MALSLKPFSSYWRCKSLKMDHWYLVSYFFKVSVIPSWALTFLPIITQTGGNSTFVTDCFQLVFMKWSNVSVQLRGLFLIVFGQRLSSMGQRSEIYQALDTQMILSWINWISVFYFFEPIIHNFASVLSLCWWKPNLLLHLLYFFVRLFWPLFISNWVFKKL